MSAALVLALVLADEAAAAPPAPAGAGVFDRRELRERPHGADLASLLRDVPGIVPDRTAVGGSDVAQQPVLVSRGDPGTGATFVVDGVDVTDVVAPGSSLLQVDLDALESVRVRTFGEGVRVRSTGPHVELTLRTPSAGRHGAAHLRLAPDVLQSDNLPDELRERPLPRTRTDHVVEMGGELSGHAWGDRLWLHGAASRDAVRQQAFTGHEERLRSDSLLGRAHWDAAPWTFRLLAARTEKQHDDRDPVLSASPGSRWRQTGPTHLAALTTTRSLGATRTARLRASWLDAGFRLDAQGGRSATVREDLRGVYQGSYVSTRHERPRASVAGDVSGGGRGWLGAHAWQAGAGYERRTARARSEWPGDKVLALERQSVFFRTFRLTGFALPLRDQDAHARVEALHVFAEDEMTRGDWALRLGLRVERLDGRRLAAAVGANPAFPELLPAVGTPAGGTGITWTDVLPRLTTRWTPGPWTLEGGWGRYAAPLAGLDPAFDGPLSREASLVYYWSDADADGVVDRGELDESYGRVGANNVDPAEPGSPESPQRIASTLRAPVSDETFVRLGRRLGASARVDVVGGWRRVRQPLWRPLRDVTTADYVARGTVRGELFDDAYAVVYFGPSSAARLTPGHGRVLANREGYRQDALWADVAASGRAGGVDWRAWAAFVDWREFFEDRALSIQDPTPTDAEPLRDAGQVAVRPGGLGRGDVFVNARWSAGVSGSATLPLALRVSLRGWAREGFPVPYVQPANSGDPTTGAKAVLVAPTLTRYRLPAVVLLDLGIRREWSVAGGTVGAAVDAFNLLDAATRLQGERDVELPGFDRPRELLRPRTLRVGVDYRF